MRRVFSISLCGLLGFVTSIFGYGWFANGVFNPTGVVINLLGVIVIVSLSFAIFK